MSSIEFLHSLQAEHDAKYGLDESLLEDMRHTNEHVEGIIGKFAKTLRPVRHGAPLDTSVIEDEVIGDLLYWALHLGNRLGIDVEQAYRKRLLQAQARINAERAASMACSRELNGPICFLVFALPMIDQN